MNRSQSPFFWRSLFLTSKNTVQKILVMTGPGGSGKGTFMEISRALVGEHNCCELRTEHLDGRFETGRYYHSSLLCGSDVPPNFLSCPGAERLKALTGGDKISGETKHKNTRDRAASVAIHHWTLGREGAEPPVDNPGGGGASPLA